MRCVTRCTLEDLMGLLETLGRSDSPASYDGLLGALGLDSPAVRQQAFYAGLGRAGQALLDAGAPAPYRRSFGAGLGQALGAFGQGQEQYYDNELRRGLTAMQLARLKQRGEREAEQDRLRSSALLELQTGGRKIPTVQAFEAMNGNTPAPGDRGGKGGRAIHTSSRAARAEASGDLDLAIRQTVGLPYGVGMPMDSGPVGMQPNPMYPPVATMQAMRANEPPLPDAEMRSGVRSAPQSGTPGSFGIPGMGPAMQQFLLSQSPSTFATMMHNANRPHILNRGALMVDAQGRKIAEGAPLQPRVRNMVIGGEIIPHQYDEDAGEWVPIEGMGGPRFSGRGAGGLTAAQSRDNEQIDAARAALAQLNMDAAAIREATTKTTATGRENPRYNPNIEAMVRRAARRKIGSDPNFETTYSRLMIGEPQVSASSDGAVGVGGLAEAAPIPMSGGKIATGQLKKGSVYTLPNGARARWDGMQFETE